MAGAKREVLDELEEAINLTIDYRRKLLQIEASLMAGEEPDAERLAENMNDAFKGLSGKDLKRFTSEEAKSALASILADLSELQKKKAPGNKDKWDPNEGENTLYCSFCGKSQHEVKKLIAGPSVFICEECTELCMTIIRAETPPPSTGTAEDKS